MPGVEEMEVTFAVTTRLRRVGLKVSDDSGGRDGSATSCPWSLTYKQQVKNLKENWRKALYWTGTQVKLKNNLEANLWFAKVVAQLQVDPCLDSSKLKIEESLLGQFLWGATMNSLDLAILMGDLKMVQKILESSSVPNDVIHGPIQDLSRNRKFLQLTPIFDTCMKTGILYTPLHLAVEGEDIDIVAMLLEKGGDVNALNWLSQTPLDLACKKGNVAILQQLLAKDNEGQCPLHVAVQLGDIDFIRRLSFLNVNAVDHKDNTPLHLAVEGGNSNIVDFLLEKGADVNARNLSNERPLDLACKEENGTILQQLLANLAKESDEMKGPFHIAVHLREVNFIKLLPSLNVNAMDHKGETPLHLAIEGGNSDIVAMLLEKGADVNAQNLSYETPLDFACKKENLTMLEQLLAKDNEGKDPLHVAVRFGDMDFINLLSSQNFNAMDYKKNTVLHLAVEGGNRDIVALLLEKNIDVNAQNLSYETPLDFACKKENLTMLEQLLAKDNEGKGPLHVAVRHGDINFIKRLPNPLNVNVEDHQKKTPLHYLATRNFSYSNFTNIVKYLNQQKALDMKALDSSGLSSFYVAILYCNTELVYTLLESFPNQIRLTEACNIVLGPPIQIAMEGGDKFKDIKRVLMECDHVKGFIENLYRDRQVYMDAANAILVGAALIASVTFASWLQPPLNYTPYFGEGYSSFDIAPSTSDFNYVDVEHNIGLRAFWIFNAFSFYFSIGTIICGARSVLPRGHLFIKKTVDKLHTSLLVTSTLLACSILFVIIAFAIAGTIVLTPLVKYQWYMIVPTIVGGMVCIISLVYLVRSMVGNYFNTSDNSDRSNKKKSDYLSEIGYPSWR